MKIISHRGYWQRTDEKNTEIAFNRSFALKFGTETDLRDFASEIVISHDMPLARGVTLIDFLQMAQKYSAEANTLTLALNVKADGMAPLVAEAIKEFPSLDCFVFDMAVPDMLSYFANSIPVFTRMSEVEKDPAWMARSAGVWLDAFESLWYDESILGDLLENKRVCIVSNELHQRSHIHHWDMLKPFSSHPNLILCTDYPEEATTFFEVREEL